MRFPKVHLWLDNPECCRNSSAFSVTLFLLATCCAAARSAASGLSTHSLPSQCAELGGLPLGRLCCCELIAVILTIYERLCLFFMFMAARSFHLHDVSFWRSPQANDEMSK